MNNRLKKEDLPLRISLSIYPHDLDVLRDGGVSVIPEEVRQRITEQVRHNPAVDERQKERNYTHTAKKLWDEMQKTDPKIHRMVILSAYLRYYDAFRYGEHKRNFIEITDAAINIILEKKGIPRRWLHGDLVDLEYYTEKMNAPEHVYHLYAINDNGDIDYRTPMALCGAGGNAPINCTDNSATRNLLCPDCIAKVKYMVRKLRK